MRQASGFGLLVLLLISLFVFSVFAQNGIDPIGEITAALRARDFSTALQLLQPALQHSPNSAQLWTLQALAYSGKGQRKDALAAFRSALRISPDYLPALEGLAQLEYESGNAAAVPLLQHVLRLHPNDPTTHAMLAVIAFKRGDCASAVQQFAQSGSLVDSQPGALQEYGICLVEVKQSDKAITIFKRILASHPDDPRARRSLATVQLSAGQTQDAITTLQPLLESGKPDVSGMQLAAAAYEANKDTPHAVKVLHEAIVKDPHNIALYVDFANIAMTHQSFQTGIDMIDAGLNLEPKAAELYLARGVLYVQLADYEKAEADFERAEQLDPHQTLSAAAQSMVAEERNQNDPDRALATVRSKLAKKPGNAFLWYLQAAIIAQKAPNPGSAEFQEAMQSGKKAVGLQPSLSAAHNLLGKLYLQEGQIALAIKECRLVLRDNPADQTALYHLVLALRKTNDKAEIPELLKRLAKARQEATEEEAEQNRYKLITEPSPQSD
ncbi:MAG TPA: tetratricopeptide repeat protein [Candidatus Sulfotelmatobacter sp.]|nr:tetratricopeptide repeat protein [Candidatus Sulfotelmatobacter sp.]